MSDFQTICKTEDVPPGQARLFVLGDMRVGVFCIEDEFFALRNECPHAGASLAHGLIVGDTVACRIHHWRFSIRDGTYLDECQPACNAHSFPVRVVGDNVQIDLSPDSD